MDRPNIVIFLSDDLGYNDLSCYMPGRHHTPNIDRLAAEGIRFTDFHSNGPVCSPTRASLLTGNYPQRYRIENALPNLDRNGHPEAERPQLPCNEMNFGRAFADAGYATAFFGKYHTGHMPGNSPIKLGFGEFRGLCGGMDHHSHVSRLGVPNWWVGEERAAEEGYSTDLITDHGIRFMEENRDRPFLLYLADWCVHFPWQGPEDRVDFEEGGNFNDTPVKWGSQYPHRHLKAYREMVEAQDRNLGRIAGTLEELGLTEQTLLIYMSDNGGHHEVTDNAPLRGAKGDVFEGGHRVPAFVRRPGTITAGRVSSETAMTMDIFPTILTHAGVRIERQFDGIDLSAHLIGDASLPERTLFWRKGEKKAVRRGRWKYVDADATRTGAAPLLFDLDTDLAETRDVAAEQPEAARELAAALADWEREVGPAPPV